jgi:hypothetical protein
VTTKKKNSQIFYIKILSKKNFPKKKLAKLLEFTLRKKNPKNSKNFVEKWQRLWKKALVTTI